MPFRQRRKSLAMPGKQRLIGGHDRLAGGERGLYRALGGIARPADNLDQHIDRRIARQRHRIGDPAKLLRFEIALFAARAGGDRDDLDAASATRHQLVAALIEEMDDSAADGSETGKTDFQRLSHETSPT